jgi:hypothetical protein
VTLAHGYLSFMMQGGSNDTLPLGDPRWGAALGRNNDFDNPTSFRFSRLARHAVYRHMNQSYQAKDCTVHHRSGQD